MPPKICDLRYSEWLVREMIKITFLISCAQRDFFWNSIHFVQFPPFTKPSKSGSHNSEKVHFSHVGTKNSRVFFRTDQVGTKNSQGSHRYEKLRALFLTDHVGTKKIVPIL